MATLDRCPFRQETPFENLVSQAQNATKLDVVYAVHKGHKGNEPLQITDAPYTKRGAGLLLRGKKPEIPITTDALREELVRVRALDQSGIVFVCTSPVVADLTFSGSVNVCAVESAKACLICRSSQ